MIYELKCEECGNGRRASDGGLSIQMNDGSLAVLGSPGELRAAGVLGSTLDGAASEARLVRSADLLCPACGGLFVRRDRVAPFGIFAIAFGCTGVLAFVV